MSEIVEGQKDVAAPLRVIRAETVLSRLPIHNLAKKGTVDIRILRRDREEQVELRWEVSHSAKYGPPRQLAYKLDTLVVNRRIEESGRPVPRFLRLGSLRDIARDLRLGGDTNSIRKALRQNAFTGITAKLVYRAANGSERRIEADFTRYSVVFAGEVLPDGRAADSVYIVLNDPYLDVVNNAPVRPLNYDYLRELPPAAQRFYEIVSFKMFSALKNGHPHARLVYSEYCTYAPQQRYHDYDHFKKQMYKVHRLHVASGYLGGMQYRECRDANGEIDWMMLYVPGARARAEFAAFERTPSLTPSATRGPATEPLAARRDLTLAGLERRGISQSQAAALLANAKPGQPILEQLAWADELIARAQGRIYNPPGFYIYLIREDIRAPGLTTASPDTADPAPASGPPAPDHPPQVHRAYEDFCAAKLQQHIRSTYSDAELAALLDRKRLEIQAQFPSAKLWSPDSLSRLAEAALRADIARQILLPTLRQFAASLPQ
jgi:hypothetical protein